MNGDLTVEQEARCETARRFAGRFTVQEATAWDQAEAIPPEVIRALGEAGLMGACLPEADGGLGWDAWSFGRLCAELGAVSLSLVSVLTVHSMVLEALRAWGTDEQKARWLGPMARGEMVGAFALTEPERGCDAAHSQTTLNESGANYVLSGRKKWISYAQRADLFLVFAQLGGTQPIACLVPRSTPGLSVTPLRNMLGFRAALIGEVALKDCSLTSENILGRPGGGFSHVANRSLDLGRFTVAFGCLGCMEACLMDSVVFARTRHQFDVPLTGHQLILEMISDMITAVKVSEQICRRAAELRQAGDPASIVETTVAKYFVSKSASEVAGKAVQIHGAIGCSGDESRVERLFRDARIGEIIEGSNQMQQLMIARSGMAEYVRRARRRTDTPKREKAG